MPITDNVSPFTISGEVLDEFNKPIGDLDVEHDRPNTTAYRTDPT